MLNFGTDGIRFEVDELLDIKLNLLIDRLNEISSSFVIGMDTRISSLYILTKLTNGLVLKNNRVVVLGVMPTPYIINYTYYNDTVGVIVTASHNPYYYNGIKLAYKGKKLNSFSNLIKDRAETGLVYDYDYIRKINNRIGLIKTTKRVLFDAANGSTSIFSFNKSIDVVNNKPNGFNINENCGSLFINKYIGNKDYEFVFAVDGDGDRLLLIYNGLLLNGDMILYLIITSTNAYNSVVLDELSNPGVIEALEKRGIKTYISKVGDSNVLDMMNRNNVLIGGEASGHIIINDLIPTGDGITLMSLLLKLSDDASFNELVNEVVLWYRKDYILPVNINYGLALKIINHVKADEKIILRKSGTEKLTRLIIMAKDFDKLNKLGNYLYSYLKELIF